MIFWGCQLFHSVVKLLRKLLPLAFVSLEKTEEWDKISLTQITKNLDVNTKSFFDAICMLAFADIPEHISLGEFARTIIRANPIRGGTTEFGYPANGGYDMIAKVMAEYIEETRTNSKIILRSAIRKVQVENGQVTGIVTSDERLIESNCVIISYPAYLAINELFDDGIFDRTFVEVNRLNKTTSVVEVHFALSRKIDQRQVVFPVGDKFTAKGIFFISNISESVSPTGEHLILAGTAVSSQIARSTKDIKNISDKMKDDLQQIYPAFREALLWERPMAWKMVESIVKEPGLVWKQNMPHHIDQVRGLFFVGDSTISFGIGTDSAAHSALLCYAKILAYLKN